MVASRPRNDGPGLPPECRSAVAHLRQEGEPLGRTPFDDRPYVLLKTVEIGATRPGSLSLANPRCVRRVDYR